MLGGYAYIVDQTNQAQADPTRPEREATLSIAVTRLFEAGPEQARGIGRIVESEPHLADVKNRRVYFSLAFEEGGEGSNAASVGSILHCVGLVSPVLPEATANGFDAYLVNARVSLRVKRGVVHAIDPNSDGLRALLDRLLQSARRTLSLGLDASSRETKSYRAMLLGIKGELDPEQKQRFLQNGALHLFAISGLHIGVIATCGHQFLQLFRLSRKWIPIPNLCAIASFVAITGGAPSAWRATLMIACYYLCLASKRQTAALNALFLSALICLVIDPFQLFLAGFQLSYTTVAAILLYGVPIAHAATAAWNPCEDLPRESWRAPHYIVHFSSRFALSSFGISLSAFLASSTLSIIYFNTISFIGIVANIILIPLASLVIIAGFLSLLSGIIHLTPLTVLWNNAAEVVLSAMHAILYGLERLGPAFLTIESPPVGLLFLLLVLLLSLFAYGYAKRWDFPKSWLWTFPSIYTSICLAIARFL